MIKIEKPESVVPTLTGESENLSLDGDKIYTNKVTAPQQPRQLSKLLDESRKLLANRQKKVFPAWVQQEVAHRVFTKLIELLTLTETTKRSLIQHGFGESEIEKLNFRSCPGEIENRLICYELETTFGDLSGFLGFVRMESCAFRMNLSPYLKHSGIVLPKRNQSTGRIYCLSVFRSIQDSYGFILRSNIYQRRLKNEY